MLNSSKNKRHCCGTNDIRSDTASLSFSFSGSPSNSNQSLWKSGSLRLTFDENDRRRTIDWLAPIIRWWPARNGFDGRPTGIIERLPPFRLASATTDTFRLVFLSFFPFFYRFTPLSTFNLHLSWLWLSTALSSCLHAAKEARRTPSTSFSFFLPDRKSLGLLSRLSLYLLIVN